MKKEYNRATMSDMPMDTSLNSSSVQTTPAKKTTAATKPKINVVGNKKKETSGGTKSTTAKSTTAKSINQKTSKENKNGLRTKLVGSAGSDLSNLEELNEQNLKAYRFASRRNKVVIAILSFLLIVSIASIAIYMGITKLKANCNMIIEGRVDAEYIIDGLEINEFRAPSNLQGNRTLVLKIEIRIKTPGKFKIHFVPKCYQKGILMENTLVYKFNNELFYEDDDGVCYSIEPISGNQTILLCEGIILDREYASLNVDTFKMDFYTYFEKI